MAVLTGHTCNATGFSGSRPKEERQRDCLACQRLRIKEMAHVSESWNLGSCDRHFPDCINIDICEPADRIADLRERWPGEDSTVKLIRAYDLIEHLPDKIHTMNEAWRVLEPGGIFDIEVPTTDGPGAWQDPTHVSYWNRNSFTYYTQGEGNRERFKDRNGVVACFRVVSDRLQKWPHDGVVKLYIQLEAVK